MADGVTEIPQVIEGTEEMNEIQRAQYDLKMRMARLISDSITVLHAAVKGEEMPNGEKVTRTQIYAASPLVSKFAPSLEYQPQGGVHLHFQNIPRPSPKELEKKKPQIEQGTRSNEDEKEA